MKSLKLLFLILLLNQVQNGAAIDCKFIHGFIIDFNNITSTDELEKYITDLPDPLTCWSYDADNNPREKIIMYHATVDDISIYNATLRTFPANLFQTFPTMREIDIKVDVGLEEITPQHFEWAGKLTKLHLMKNKLKKIDNQILLNCKNLINLDLSENQLEELFVPGTVKNAKADKNKISKLSFKDNSELEWLSLTENNLENEAALELNKLVNLKVLNLSRNALTSLSYDSFAYLESLEVLNLSHNKIACIGYGAFGHQTSLRILDLSYNQRAMHDFKKFSALSSLTFLDISFNNDTVREVDARRYLPSLTEIAVDGYRYRCDDFSVLKVDWEKQGIIISRPRIPTRNAANIIGIECIEQSSCTPDKSEL